MVPPMLTNLELTERGTESVKIHKEPNDRAPVDRHVKGLKPESTTTLFRRTAVLFNTKFS